jgi:hypothetical protein
MTSSLLHVGIILVTKTHGLEWLLCNWDRGLKFRAERKFMSHVFLCCPVWIGPLLWTVFPLVQHY